MVEMNNISSRDSPKTPGGISKSFLTPIRRVGLSRNWKNRGSSQFISPVSNPSSIDAKPVSESIKRKLASTEDGETIGELHSMINESNSPLSSNINTVDVNRTPTRNLLPRKKSKTLLLTKEITEEPESIPNVIPCDEIEVESDPLPRKKSKTLLLTKEITEEPESIPNVIACGETEVESDSLPRKKSKTLLLTKEITNEPECIPDVIDCKNVCDDTEVECDSPQRVKISKLSRANSKSQSKVHKLSSKVEIIKEPDILKEETLLVEDTTKGNIKASDSKVINIKKENSSANDCASIENKSPNNLTKECVVVIQNNIYKSLEESNQKLKPILENSVVQALCDSDSDDVPLININKENKIESIINNDDDFQETKKVVKLQDKTTSISGLKQKKARKKSKQVKSMKIDTPSSQSSYSFEDDDDDDFVVAKNKTILIKKSYDKPAKPLKVKSTGSITQKDIDEIKGRIERKKKLLLAKAMTNESAELGFIKKWQAACQNALTELCDLMKKNMPDKQNMDYAEMLQILKIPPELVGYDSENDCFNTPDDLTIILSGFNT